MSTADRRRYINAVKLASTDSRFVYPSNGHAPNYPFHLFERSSFESLLLYIIIINYLHDYYLISNYLNIPQV